MRVVLASLVVAAGAASVAMGCERVVNLANVTDGSAMPSDAQDTGDPNGDSGASDVRIDGPSPPDASDGSAKGPRGIFITRATYSANFGSLAQGDFRCQASAAAASLGGTWKAWLSDSSHDAADRITSDGPWIAAKTNVTLFANHANLRGFPLAGLLTDELGTPAPDRWWTGTLANGVRSPKTCSDWTSNSATAGATTGTRDGAGVPGKEWTEDGAFVCQSAFALLCLQD